MVGATLRWSAIIAWLAIAGAGAPTATATDGPPFKFSDGQDDVALEGLGDAPSPFSDYVDITGFEAVDDETEILFKVRVRDLHVANPPIVVGDDRRAFYHVYFELEKVAYRADVQVQLYPYPAEPGLLVARYTDDELLCQAPEGDQCARRQGFYSYLDGATESIVLRFDRAQLTSEALPYGPLRGSSITAIHVESEARTFSSDGGDPLMSDVAPDGAPAGPFVLGHPTANHFLRIRSNRLGSDFSVSAGFHHAIELNITSLVLQKRIIALEASWEPGEPNAQFVSVFVPPTVTVPGNQSRIVRMTINVTDATPVGTTAAFVVRGHSVAFPNETAVTRFRMRVTPTVSPERSNFYLHARWNPEAGWPLPNEAKEICRVFKRGCSDSFVSPDRSDPTASDPDEHYAGFDDDDDKFFSYTYLTVGTIGNPVGIDPSAQIHINVTARALRSYSGTEVRARVGIDPPGDGNSVTALDQTTTMDLGSEAKTATISGKLKASTPTILPRGTWISITLVVYVPPEAQTTERDGIVFIGGDTNVHLPLAPVPPGLEAAAPSAFQISVLDGESEEFINPSETQAFRVALLNQGAEPQRAMFSTSAPPEGWSVELVPGLQFDLDSGDVIVVTVLLKAPPSGAEGQRVNVTVFADDEEAQRVSVELKATLLLEYDVPDEAGTYIVDGDAKEKLVATPKKETPGPGSLLFAAALAGAILVRRRRDPPTLI